MLEIPPLTFLKSKNSDLNDVDYDLNYIL